MRALGVTVLVMAGGLLAAGSASPAPDLTALREQARGILRSHCGECHVSNLPGANAAAVKVFDLVASDWAASLDGRQLREAEHRLKGKKPAAADRQLFHAFVEQQSARAPKK